MAIVGIGVVAAFVLREPAENSAPAWQSIAAIAALGCASLATQPLISRPLDCTSAKTLAVSYRARFFVRLATSEVVALAAFVLGAVWGPWWVFFVGAAFTLVGFARLAPTQRNLQHDQDRLSLGGCTLSVIAALRTRSA